LGISVETALKIASPFGGGIARQGQVCGALTGALMVLGLQRDNATVDGKDATYRLAEEFVHRFEKHHGTMLCRELIGYDLSKPEELIAARDHNVFHTICPGLVKDTAQAISEFLTE
jgi:C_GCAxxG_C_C family probable redox protein